MIHELIDPKKKTKRTRSSKNTKSLIPAKFNLEETGVEGSENKDSCSTVYISPWIRNSFGGKQKSKLSLDWNICLPNFNGLGRNSISPTDLKPIKISLGRSYESDADNNSYKANAEDDLYGKPQTHLELFGQTQTNELIHTQESEEVRVFDLCQDENSGETSRRKSSSVEERPVKNEPAVLATANTVNGDLSRSIKTTKQKNKPRRRLPVTSRPTDITQHDIEMALLLEMKARKALDSYMRASSRSASSDGKFLASGTQAVEKDICNELRNSENVTTETDGAKQTPAGNSDGVLEGTIVEDKELPQKNEISTKESPQEDDKCKKETLLDDEKPTKEAPQKIETPNEAPQKIETPNEAPQKIETPNEAPQKIETPNEAPQKTETPKEAPQKIETPKEAPQKIETPKEAPQKIETSKEVSFAVFPEKKIETAKEAPKKIETTKEVPQKIETAKEAPQKIETAKETPKKIETPKEVPQKIETAKEAPQKIETTKEAPKKIETPKEAPKKIETLQEPPKMMEEDCDRKHLAEFLPSDKEEEDEETKCLEEVKKFMERKKRTRQTRHLFFRETSPEPRNPEPDNLDDVPKEKLKLYRVKGSNIVPCSENVVGKAVDEALQKFVDIYHFHVSHGVMEDMKKDIMRALTTESRSNSCIKLSKDGKDISNFPEFDEKDCDILKQDRLLTKEPPPGDVNLCKEVLKKCSSSTALRKEFETFLSFIRTHIDISNLKVRNVILEEKGKKGSSERLQFVCNFAKKEVIRVKQSKQEETQTTETVNQKKHVKLQVFEPKEATCDKNLQTIVHGETQTVSEPPTIKKSVKLQVFESRSTCDKSQETETPDCCYKTTQTEQATISEIKSLRRCNIRPGLYRLIKSKEGGKFFLYQEHKEASQDLSQEDSEDSAVKDEKYSTELRSQTSKERNKDRNFYYEGKDRIKKRKKNRQRKKKSEDGKKDSIDYLYFRNFDKKDSESSFSGLGVFSDDKIPVKGEHVHDVQLQEEQSGSCWMWDGKRISPGCDLKSEVENLVMEKLRQMCSLWYNTNDTGLSTTNEQKEEEEEEEMLHRTISERTFDVASFKDMGDQSPTQMEEKWPSKKEENSEGEDMLYSGREDSVRSVEALNVDWKFVSQYLPKLRDFGKKPTSKKKHFRRNSVPRYGSPKMDKLREAEELLLTVEKLKEINVNVNKVPMSEDNAMGNYSSTSGNKTAAVEDPLLTLNSDNQQFSNSESQRGWDEMIALANHEMVPDNFYNLNVAMTQDNEPAVDKRKQMELMGNVFSRFKRHEKENLWRHIRKVMKKKIRRDVNTADNPEEVCIEIEQEIPENREGMNPSFMGKNDCAQFEGEFEMEVDLTLDDLERILNHRRKKMKKRSSYRSRHLKSSSSTHSDHKDNLQEYNRYLRRLTTPGNELERFPNSF